MKTLFIVLCDIMFLCMVAAPVAGAVWLVSALNGWATTGPAKIACIVALIGCVVFLAASFAAWKLGGDNDDKEGGK
jgi:hypothetical protein